MINLSDTTFDYNSDQTHLLVKEMLRVYSECGSKLRDADFRENELKQALDYKQKRIDELLAEKSSLSDELKEIYRIHREFFRRASFLLYSESIAISRFEVRDERINSAWHFGKTQMGDWCVASCDLVVDAKSMDNSAVVSLNFGENKGVETELGDISALTLNFDDSSVFERKFTEPVSTHNLNATQYCILERLFDFLVQSYGNGDIEFESTMSNSDIRSMTFCLENILKSLRRERKSFRFDKVYLKDTLVKENYEQLWLKFKNVNWEDKFFSEFEFKVEAKRLKAEVYGRPFAKHLCISFRQLEDGGFPLEFWPPDSVDQYGAYMTYTFDIERGRLMLTKGNELVRSDACLLFYLFEKIPYIVKQLDDFEVTVERPQDQWLFALNRLKQLGRQLLASFI